MWVDTLFLAKLHLSRASVREFYGNKISHLTIAWLRRGAGFWYFHTSLMESSTSTAASKHREETCTYLGFIPQQPLASSRTPQPTRSTRAPIFLCPIPYLQMPLVTGNCWEDRKAGSLGGMENTGNILWVLRPPQPCRAEVPHPFSIHTSLPRLTILMSWASSLTEPNATHASHKTKK